MTRRPLIAALATLTAAAAFSACGGEEGGDSAGTDTKPTAAKTDAATVQTKTFIYSPDPLTVKAGTTVTWTNSDGTTHTITAGTRDKPEPKQFDGELMPTTGKFEHTFDKPGTYPYFCSLHKGEGMTGEVIVN